MGITDDQVAKLEARLRAIEAILNCLPTVVTTEVLARARREIGRPYRHPDSVVDMLNIAQQRELADAALTEIERQMTERPA
jgi:hypothetical protein